VGHVLITLLVVVLVIGIAAFAFLKSANGGFSARAELSAIETRPPGGPDESPFRPRSKRCGPVREMPEVLARARAHWADDCASCRANHGSGEAETGEHM
jgi:hypothetical protein